MTMYEHDQFSNWKIDISKLTWVLLAHESSRIFSIRKNFLLNAGYVVASELQRTHKKWESYDSDFWGASNRCGGGIDVIFSQEFHKSEHGGGVA